MACTSSRHMACKLCRDRKVRCDGETPTCGRCARARENCVYVSPSNPTKADLVETVETVQDRLNKAEASLAAIQSREQVRNMRSLQEPIFSTLQMPADGLTMPSSFEDPVLMSAEATNGFDWNTMPTMNNPFPPDFSNNMMNRSRRISESPVFTSLAKRKAASDLVQSSNSSGDHSSPQKSSSSSRESLPSLTDIRKWIAGPGGEAQNPYQMDSTDTTVITSFKDFVITSMANQAKIAGVAAAMADYISWTRLREQSGGDGSICEVLEMFEARAREIAGLAETDGLRAYQQAEIIISQLASQEQVWRTLDIELAHKRGRLNMFFDKNYDIHTPLSEQR